MEADDDEVVEADVVADWPGSVAGELDTRVVDGSEVEPLVDVDAAAGACTDEIWDGSVVVPAEAAGSDWLGVALEVCDGSCCESLFAGVEPVMVVLAVGCCEAGCTGVCAEVACIGAVGA